ncbi:PREDICTED: G-protein coupled receptor 54-like [Gekko japonicus]|uniref:G-protein coupled receptor 54-like n=1 Tax=Gekko japonicus TaxID=146911 RepID=A0ABM1KL48_GEKJA|nr:PREDICTED: G-protein coupled receptor 54-like [Gekko japonicus]
MNVSLRLSTIHSLLEFLNGDNLSFPGPLNGSRPLGWEELEKLLFLFDKDPVAICLTAMYLVSFVVGFAGNVLSLRMLTRRRPNRRVPSLRATRSLLINLAVCDLLVVCVCMPITVGNLIYKAWVYGDFLCRAVPFVQAVSVSASVLSLTGISLNRYYSVHNPLHARSFFTRRKILGTILGVWVLSSGICMPLVFMNKRDEIGVVRGLPVVFPICTEVWPQKRIKQAYNFLLFCALYCLPVLFNMVICCLTVHRLWSPTRPPRDRGALSRILPASRLRIRKKVAQMVVALVLLFAVSWLPIYMMDLWIEFHSPKSLQEGVPPPWALQLRPFAQWLGLTNSSLNPICYCFVGNVYRSAKEMRSRYHKKMASLLSFSLSEKSLPSSIPELLSYKSSSSKELNVVVATGNECQENCDPRTQV